MVPKVRPYIVQLAPPLGASNQAASACIYNGRVLLWLHPERLLADAGRPSPWTQYKSKLIVHGKTPVAGEFFVQERGFPPLYFTPFYRILWRLLLLVAHRCSRSLTFARLSCRNNRPTTAAGGSQRPRGITPPHMYVTLVQVGFPLLFCDFQSENAEIAPFSVHSNKK